MKRLDSARIRSAWRGTLFVAETLESTSTTAFEHCRSGAALPLLVIAHQQTAGRGQRDRRWWSDAGSLTFSIALPRPAAEVRTPWTVFATALAIAEAIEGSGCTTSIQLKWPNDLLVARKKVGGILCETLADPSPAVVIGIGLNVHHPVTPPPASLRERMGWLADFFSTKLDSTDLLLEILAALPGAWNSVDPPRIVQSFRQRCVLTGELLRAHGTQYGEVQGICRGINERGEIVIERDDGVCLALPSAQLEWPLAPPAVP